MRSIRLSGPIAVILVVSHASGCGSDATNVNWSAGTAAVLRDPYAPRVMARVPTEQRAVVKHRSLAITNNTPVTILDDPAYGALPRGSTGSEPPTTPVLVRVEQGIDQGIEVLVRRGDLTFPAGPDEDWSVFLQISVYILFAAAATLWCIETLVLALKNRLKGMRDQVTIDSRAWRRSFKPAPKPITRISDRGARECNHWLTSVAAMTARSKVRCVNSRRRSGATSQ